MTKTEPMTGPELDATLRAIGWSRSELARRLGRTPQQVDKMATGLRPIRDDLAGRVRATLDAVRSIWS